MERDALLSCCRWLLMLHSILHTREHQKMEAWRKVGKDECQCRVKCMHKWEEREKCVCVVA